MNSSSAETLGLVRRAIDGDQGAMGKLFDRHRSQLTRMVSIRMDARLKARFDPSDVVQSVFAEAASDKMAALNSQPERFYPWLRQLAWDRLARLHRDHLGTQKRSVQREAPAWQGHLADESMCELADQLAAREIGPYSKVVQDELRARVRDALVALPSKDREVLVLRFLERLDTGDTAAALGITESAVKSRQFRAVERLGRLLGDLRSE